MNENTKISKETVKYKQYINSFNWSSKTPVIVLMHYAGTILIAATVTTE